MTWSSYRLRDVVWAQGGLRHHVLQWEDIDEVNSFEWETVCRSHSTPKVTDYRKKPRFHKGFVTCLQCLAKGDGDL